MPAPTNRFGHSFAFASFSVVDPGLPARTERELAREILGYFLRNPRAADTLEGVARWRLIEETIHRGVEETKGALAWLVSQGFLQDTSTVGSGRVFYLNMKKRADAEHFVMQAQSRDK